MPTHWAYIFNFIFSHILAFIGMYLLLSRHFLKGNENKLVVLLSSLLFAILPFYSTFCLTIAGQPLFFFAFLNLKRNMGKAWYNYGILMLLPFFLLGYLISPFLIIVAGLFSIWDAIDNKKVNFKLMAGIFLFILFTIIVDYQMYGMTFIESSFVSHRTEFDIGKADSNILTLGFAIQSAITLFFETQHHTGSMPTKIILVLFLLALSICFIFKKGKRLLTVIFLSIFLICVFYIANFYLRKYFGNKISILKIFQWDRFYFMLPFLWLFLLALSASIIRRHKILRFFLVTMLLFQTIYIIRKNKEVINNWKLMVGKKINEPTFSQFYSKPLFDKIDQYINQPKSTYRLASLGINPAVASFNGFYTLDGYQTSYDVNYKHEFRKIMKNDLAKDNPNKAYFDYWGNRCYLYCYEYDKQGTISVLNYDFITYKKLGGKYLFSGVQIQYPDSCGLVFKNKFSDNFSPYTVFLYQLK